MRRERCVKIGRKSSGVIFSEGAASKNTRSARRIGALARRIVEMTEHTRTVLHCIESFFSSRRETGHDRFRDINYSAIEHNSLFVSVIVPGQPFKALFSQPAWCHDHFLFIARLTSAA